MTKKIHSHSQSLPLNFHLSHLKEITDEIDGQIKIVTNKEIPKYTTLCSMNDPNYDICYKMRDAEVIDLKKIKTVKDLLDYFKEYNKEETKKNNVRRYINCFGKPYYKTIKKISKNSELTVGLGKYHAFKHKIDEILSKMGYSENEKIPISFDDNKIDDFSAVSFPSACPENQLKKQEETLYKLFEKLYIINFEFRKYYDLNSKFKIVMLE